MTYQQINFNVELETEPKKQSVYSYKMHNDPEFRAKEQKRITEYKRMRYQNDPEFREKEKERHRIKAEKNKKTKEYKKKELSPITPNMKAMSIKIRNDPEYYEDYKARNRVKLMNLYKNDENFRESIKTRNKERARKLKAEKAKKENEVKEPEFYEVITDTHIYSIQVY
jgi:hypothetical protein